MSAIRVLGEGVVLAAFGLCLGTFANAPSFAPVEGGKAIIRLTLSHGGQRLEDCRTRSAEELKSLAPNMRKARVCSRDRAAVHVMLAFDGTTLVDRRITAGGVAGDSPARAYDTFEVPPGRHRLVLGLNDSGRAEGFDYAFDREVDLVAGQSLSVDFRSTGGGFVVE